MFRVCHAVMSVPCSLVVTCWQRANLLSPLYVMFICVFVTFPCGVMGQVWYLIVSIPDLCLLPYIGMEALLVQASPLAESLCCVLEQDALSAALYRFRPNMTEKLLIGT